MVEKFLSRRALWLSRLSDEVVRGLSERIRSGVLRVGEPLPDREELMAEFVTSVAVVDRAIETLEEEDVVRRDPDGMLRVAATPRRPESPDFPQIGDATRTDVVLILELRTGVEAEAAALAAERRTEAQLAGIRKAQKAFEDATDAGSGAAQADFQFHLAVAEASGNHYVRDLTDYFGPLLIPRMRIPLTPELGGGANLERARAEHAAIVDAIAASDPDGARGAMRRHLARSLELVRSFDGTK